MKISIKTEKVEIEVEAEAANFNLGHLTDTAKNLFDHATAQQPVSIPAPAFGFSVSADTERVEREPDLIEAPCLD